MLYGQENVERGMALLDRERPGWDGRLDLDSLNIASPYHCVLGQEFTGSFVDSLLALGVGPMTDGALAHGFVAEYPDRITETWKTLVMQRRENAAPQPEKELVTA